MHVLEGHKLEVHFCDQVMTFDAPTILVIPGGMLHRLNFKRVGKVNHTMFDPHVLELVRFDEAQGNMLHELACGTMAPTLPIRCGDPGFEQLDVLLSFMDRFAKYQEAGMRLQLKGCLLQILGVLYQYGYLNKRPVRRAQISNSKEARIKELFVYINANYNRPLSIADVAARLNVTRQYFCRLFKKLTNQSFIDYINIIRLNRAAQDILLSNDAINDIALRHGFESISYFFKLFKQHFGSTPKVFRQMQGQTGFEPLDLSGLNCAGFAPTTVVSN